MNVTSTLGRLALVPATDRPDLLAEPVRRALAGRPQLAALAQVTEIDPAVSDTPVLVETHDVPAETGMEYGGITAVGLPAGWRLLVDARVVAAPVVLIGSGVRRGKLALPGSAVPAIVGAEIVEGLALTAGG